MDILTGIISNGFEVFLMVFVRMTGLFVTAPIFGRRNLPTQVKIGFAFFNAVILSNTIPLEKVETGGGILTLAVLVAKEFLVGVVIGYVAYMIFSSIYLAGQLIDMQIGFGIVSVLDPVSNIQLPVTSNFYYILCMLVFMIIKGHHALIKALYDSYEFVPLRKAAFSDVLLGDVLKIFANTFVISFKISAPIIAAILIVDVALGVISKSIPQMNVFIVGMPLKLLIGIGLLIFTLPAFVSMIENLTSLMSSDILDILKDLVPDK